MNQHAEALVHLAVAATIILVLSLVAYFIGGHLAEGILAEAGKNTPLSDWKNYYFWLVLYMGVIAGVILILWTALTHWVLGAGSSKRWLWILLGLALAALCVAVPVLFAQKYPLLAIDNSIPVLFLGCYCIVGYWAGSIIVTADKHKYTPLLASFIRA